MDSGQFTQLHQQQFQEGSTQPFATKAGVVYNLKEAQVEWQLFLRDPPVWPQPGPE